MPTQYPTSMTTLPRCMGLDASQRHLISQEPTIGLGTNISRYVLVWSWWDGLSYLWLCFWA